MRKPYNIIINNHENNKVLVDCEIWAKDEKNATEKAINAFKYQLYRMTDGKMDYNIKATAII